MKRPAGAPRDLAWKARLSHAAKNMFAKQSRQHVFARICVNFAFWGCLALLAGLLSKVTTHIPLVGGDGSPIGFGKIVEFADGDLWGLQVLSSLFLLAIMQLARRWPVTDMYREFLTDELFSACLNFGTLFFVAAITPFDKHEWHFVLPMVAGMANILVYAFWSNFRYVDKVP